RRGGSSGIRRSWASTKASAARSTGAAAKPPRPRADASCRRYAPTSDSRHAHPAPVRVTLYTGGDSPETETVLENLQRLLRDYDPDDVEVEVLDVSEAR